ncbi:hypothetical protein ARMSODRAFT_951472 [Armillaria solidipes]|uniref:Uncharacterized protein n=1 Tax=Armillaria solidipes TaxID=1076256 RepID=A0A2H3C6J4_9AGAR|nr:hypothetical protein ARMSODRAFT_951472 [Armillaria solidipes]
MVQKSKRWSFGSVFGRKKSKLSCPLKKRSETPLRNDLAAPEPRPTQLTAVETQKLLCDIYSARTNEAAPPFLQRSLFVIFHDLLRMHTTDTFDLANCEAADELLATFYGLEWKNVCDYLGLDSNKGDEQFEKTNITHINLPESVQEEMYDMIRLSVRTSDRRHVYHHVMPVVTKSLLFFGGLLHTYISDKLCLDGTTSGGFVDIMIRHQNKTILIFIILKQKFFLGYPSSELLAQVVAEMSGIFALNKKLGPPFPVYAIVSDLSQFFYYCYTGDEYMSLGNFDLAAKVDFDIETANSLTTTFLLSSFASDFFSILLEGFYFYSEDTAEHLRPLGGPALVRYKAAARVTSSYQDEIIKNFRRTVPWSKKKGLTESQKNGRANRSGKLDLASIKGLMPAITMRYKADDSNATVHLHAFETDAETGRSGFLMTWAEAEACHSFSLDSLTSCFDVGAKMLISGILEVVQKCLLVPDSSTTSSQGDDWVGARKAALEVHDTLATTMEDAERENALNFLREKLSALNLESVDLDVYRHMREDQIRKNEEHRRYRNREVELAEEGGSSDDISRRSCSDPDL